MEAQAHGIKCDNPSCDFADWSVNAKDYKEWVDRPCPKCGWNLLTRSDYNFVRRFTLVIKILNIFFGWLPKRKEPQVFNVKRKGWK